MSGKIEDEEGNPIPGARIWGWPEQSGRGAGAESAADGTFRVSLPHAVAYRFSVKADGFISIGEGGGDPEAVLEPNSAGVVLALRRSPRWTITVVDARTAEPIESYGLRVRPQPDGTWLAGVDQEEIPLGNHPGGRVTVDADPAQHLVQLQAPGYAPLSAGFEVGDAGRKELKLRMVRGSVVSAIARLRGVPVDQPTARLSPAVIKLDPSLPDEEDTLFSDNYGTDLDRYTGRPRMARGDGVGRFRIEDLAAGTYTLTITAKGAAPWTRSPLRLEAEQVLDLGPIDLRPGATVRGKLAVAAGMEAAGSIVYLDEPTDEVFVVVKADGAFEFTDLAPGEHSLVVERVPGERSCRWVVSFTVAEGATVIQDIDLAE